MANASVSELRDPALANLTKEILAWLAVGLRNEFMVMGPELFELGECQRYMRDAHPLHWHERWQTYHPLAQLRCKVLERAFAGDEIAYEVVQASTASSARLRGSAAALMRSEDVTCCPWITEAAALGPPQPATSILPPSPLAFEQ